ncbi:spondin domain-containing protein [Marinobacter caseinilyticus]|uniref:spondin domain-containing protein n=1 Tax=Marinobacter caseinilyticus TaxID=2692195 RepID=UPI00140E7DA4|nr:spondin domain-containing protein [Marinobacter caseinilyticus]
MVFHKHLWVLLPLAATVAGCHSDTEFVFGPGQQDYRYQITITNLTAGQPLSPATVVIHTADWQAFALGDAASVALETLAESGDNSDFLATAGFDSGVLSSDSGSGVIGPGASEQLTVTARASNTTELHLTWISMPVNTNDGLAALQGVPLAELDVGQRQSYLAIGYDAGTEANTETAATVPGPAASGLAEGFNPNRNDVRNAVYIHAGVVTQADGLASSTLSGTQRWDNPIAVVSVERLQ